MPGVRGHWRDIVRDMKSGQIGWLLMASGDGTVTTYA
jgi:hypothetical protein